jgi:Domain of unknown function (DUF6883)
MGYAQDAPHVLEADLRSQHLTRWHDREESNDYGRCYIIVAPLIGPNGRTETIRSVWQIDLGTGLPGLITMVPE